MKMFEYVTDDCITVSVIKNEYIPVATASASFTSDIWYVNRVLVRSELNRGKGLGSQVLSRLIELCENSQKGAMIIVEPGGYNSDHDQLIKFYEKNGFCYHDEVFWFIELLVFRTKFEDYFEDQQIVCDNLQ